IPGLIVPRAVQLARIDPDIDGLRYPLLVRSLGFHTGMHFARIEKSDALPGSLVELPGEELIALEYLDASGADGAYRKYRVMIVDGILYPLHLAIAGEWKVHYFTAGMAENP